MHEAKLKLKGVLLIVLLVMIWRPGFGYKGVYKVVPEKCPSCGFEEEHPRTSPAPMYAYNPYFHRAFQFESQDEFDVWHCRNCKFTALGIEAYKAFADLLMPPKAEDIQFAKDVAAELNHLRVRYKQRPLPRYLQYEILERTIREPRDDKFWMKFYFIKGFEYYHHNMPDKARAAFTKSIEILDTIPKEDKDNWRLKSLLFRIGIEHFLGNSDQALQQYEEALRPDYSHPHPHVYWKNCFYFNSKEIAGSFWDNPVRYMFKMRNIFLLRFFNITFIQLFLGILIGIALFWNLSFALRWKRIERVGIILPGTIIAFFYIKLFEIHRSIMSVLLITCVWGAIFLIGKLFKNGHSYLYVIVLLLPWMMLWNSVNFFEELQRVLYPMSSEIGILLQDGIDFSIYTLGLWILLAAGTYFIHFIRPQSIVASFVSLLLFFPVSTHLIQNNLLRDEYSRYYFIVPIVWYGLIILLEYGCSRKIPLELPFSKRLHRMHDGVAWSVNRFFFLIYPVVMLVDIKDDSLWSDLKYLPFWGLVLLAMWLLRKISDSIPMTILMLILTGMAMFYYDNPHPDHLEGPIFFFLTGILWLCLLVPFAARLKKKLGNKFFLTFSTAFFVLPILYAIFRVWYLWRDQLYWYLNYY